MILNSLSEGFSRMNGLDCKFFCKLFQCFANILRRLLNVAFQCADFDLLGRFAMSLCEEVDRVMCAFFFATACFCEQFTTFKKT